MGCCELWPGPESEEFSDAPGKLTNMKSPTASIKTADELEAIYV